VSASGNRAGAALLREQLALCNGSGRGMKVLEISGAMPFYSLLTNQMFAKTGSGQTQEKLRKRRFCMQGSTAAPISTRRSCRSRARRFCSMRGGAETSFLRPSLCQNSNICLDRLGTSPGKAQKRRTFSRRLTLDQMEEFFSPHGYNISSDSFIGVSEEDLVPIKTSFVPCHASNWLAMNVLQVSPTTVLVEKQQVKIAAKLRAHGFEVVPVHLPFTRDFSGSLHCVAAPLSRERRMDRT
jgi:hypothetical protein